MSKNNPKREAIIKLVITQIILGDIAENIDIVIDRRFKRQREGG